VADEVNQLTDKLANLINSLLEIGEIDERLDRIEKRLARQEKQTARIPGRLNEHKEQIEDIISRLDDHVRQLIIILNRLDEYDGRLNRFEERREKQERQFAEIKDEINGIKTDLEQLQAKQDKIINTLKLFDSQIKANQAMLEKLKNSEDYLQF